MASKTTESAAQSAAEAPEPRPQDMQAMRRKFMRFGLMISPIDPLHDDPQNALADKVLADAVALLSATSSWNASDALTAIQGKRKRMMDNQEADEDEYMVATVMLAQEIKLARQRSRIAQLEAALLQLKNDAVYAYESNLEP